jgi:cell division protein FtsB
MSNARLNMLAIFFFALLLFLQYRLWFEAGGIKDMYRLKRELALQEQKNDAMKKQNDELLFQVERLQKSQDATESRARNELGMIKKDEVFYQIVK